MSLKSLSVILLHHIHVILFLVFLAIFKPEVTPDLMLLHAPEYYGLQFPANMPDWKKDRNFQGCRGPTEWSHVVSCQARDTASIRHVAHYFSIITLLLWDMLDDPMLRRNAGLCGDWGDAAAWGCILHRGRRSYLCSLGLARPCSAWDSFCCRDKGLTIRRWGWHQLCVGTGH